MNCPSKEKLASYGGDSSKFIEERNKHPECEEEICKRFRDIKIRANIDEYKTGRYSSIRQAVAVGYSQTRKYLPFCKPYMKPGGAISHNVKPIIGKPTIIHITKNK